MKEECPDRRATSVSLPHPYQLSNPALWERARVLVVCKHAHLGTVLYRYLSRFDYVTRQVADSRQAVEAFHRHPFDLVVADLQMPFMDGAALAAWIKARAPATPVVIMTGQGTAAVEQSGVQETAAAVLYKPFDLERLLATVDALTRQRPRIETAPLDLAAAAS